MLHIAGLAADVLADRLWTLLLSMLVIMYTFATIMIKNREQWLD